MTVLGALALIGLVVLLGVLIWHGRQVSAPPTEPDLAAPYREGLEAAARIQTVALELEQQLYAEAMRHATDEPGSER
jgi:hypothetical protein